MPHHTEGRVTDDFLFDPGLGKSETDRWLSSFQMSQLERGTSLAVCRVQTRALEVGTIFTKQEGYCKSF